MKPSVGRIVHYVSHGTPLRSDGSQAFTRECRAAVITAIGDMPPGTENINTEASPVMPNVGLCVLNPTGLFFHEDVRCSHPANREGGTWHWPEREPEGEPPQVHVVADFSPQQVKRITEMVQAALLQQAKRGRR